MPNKIFFAPNGNVRIQEFGNEDDPTQLTSEWEGAAALTQVRVSDGKLLLNRYGSLDTKAFKVADFVGCLSTGNAIIPAGNTDTDIAEFLLSCFSGKQGFTFVMAGNATGEILILLNNTQGAKLTASIFSNGAGKSGTDKDFEFYSTVSGVQVAAIDVKNTEFATGEAFIPPNSVMVIESGTKFGDDAGATITLTWG